MAQASDPLLPGTTAVRATLAATLTGCIVADTPLMPAAPGLPRLGAGGFPTAVPAEERTLMPRMAATTTTRALRPLPRCEILVIKPVLIHPRLHAACWFTIGSAPPPLAPAIRK